MNLNDADPGTITDYAGALFGQDSDVDVPPLSNVTAVRRSASSPSRSHLIAQTGHYHFRGRRFSTYRWDNGAARRRDLPPRGLHRSAVQVYDPPLPIRGGPGPRVGVLLGEPERRRIQVRPVHRHQRALQPVRLLLSDRSRCNESITCVQEGRRRHHHGARRQLGSTFAAPYHGAGATPRGARPSSWSCAPDGAAYELRRDGGGVSSPALRVARPRSGAPHPQRRAADAARRARANGRRGAQAGRGDHLAGGSHRGGNRHRLPSSGSPTRSATASI